jgi:hypothetical protein
MSVPQKEKEGPASTMLRAVFAGIGSLLSVVDRARGKSAAEATTDAETPAPAPTAAASEAAPAEPETVAPETVVAETETVVAETATPETATPETATPETAAELPLANYDELSVASLRARLRNLSAGQLTQLIEYEKSNAARADVIAMFERRIAKVEAEA